MHSKCEQQEVASIALMWNIHRWHVSFSALTLLVRRQEEHPPLKGLRHLPSNVLLWNKHRKKTEEWGGTGYARSTWKMAVKMKVSLVNKNRQKYSLSTATHRRHSFALVTISETTACAVILWHGSWILSHGGFVYLSAITDTTPYLSGCWQQPLRYGHVSQAEFSLLTG